MALMIYLNLPLVILPCKSQVWNFFSADVSLSEAPRAMQVALTLFFSLSCIAVPTLIGDKAFGNFILTVGWILLLGVLCLIDGIIKMLEPQSSVPEPRVEAEAGEGSKGVEDEGADTAERTAGGVEISPTLHFVAEEPEVPAGDRLEISPTLPFDIDASALQEACGVEDGSTAAEPAPEAATGTTVPAVERAEEEEDVEEASSEEDEEIKADTRLVRERAWLRHKRQMQAAQGQEDDDEAFGPVGRAPKRRAKASILMGAV
eukprot:s529_g3.t1